MCPSCGTHVPWIISLIGFVIWILVLVWVYNDAEANGNGGCLWVFLVWFFGLVGLAVYLIFFHPSPVPRRHRATNRNADFLYRAQYCSPGRSGSGPGPLPSTWGSDPQGSGATPDADFRDDELERLINAGKFSEARAYLRDMLSIAREMNDAKGMANYRQYEIRIARAASEQGRTSLR